MTAEHDRFCELYMGGLPLDADETEIAALLAPFGEVRDLDLKRHEHSGASRGFGFLKMPQDCVQAAIDALDGTELRDHRVRLNIARDKGAPAPRRRY